MMEGRLPFFVGQIDNFDSAYVIVTCYNGKIVISIFVY